MTKFKELNDKICSKLEDFFKNEEIHFKKAIEIKIQYEKYLEYKGSFPFIILNNDLTYKETISEDFLKKYTSPLKKGNDQYFYFGFLIPFHKHNNMSYVKSNSVIILGIKVTNEKYEIKILDKNTHTINNEKELNNFNSYIDEHILNIALELNSNEFNNKMGF